MRAHDVLVRKGQSSDLDAVKRVADSHREELGFLTRGTLESAIVEGHLIVANVDDEVVGFQHYYHRKRDKQTTLYHKAVLDTHRRRGIARKLVSFVAKEADALGRTHLLLKCPVDLEANEAHARLGFRLVGTEKGRRRRLNVWRLDIDGGRILR